MADKRYSLDPKTWDEARSGMFDEDGAQEFHVLVDEGQSAISVGEAKSASRNAPDEGDFENMPLTIPGRDYPKYAAALAKRILKGEGPRGLDGKTLKRQIVVAVKRLGHPELANLIAQQLRVQGTPHDKGFPLDGPKFNLAVRYLVMSADPDHEKPYAIAKACGSAIHDRKQVKVWLRNDLFRARVRLIRWVWKHGNDEDRKAIEASFRAKIGSEPPKITKSKRAKRKLQP